MKHMVVLSLLNNIKVYVVTHVKVKYRSIVALSDDDQYFILLLCNAFIIKHTLHLNFIDFVKPIYILSYKIIYVYGLFNCQRDY
jgi:hypothetical protein